MTDSKVKDKRITVNGCQFRGTVEYYQDRPSRDNHLDRWEMFETLREAQKWLEKFPRDDWDGHALSDYNYIEIDERKKNATTGTPRRTAQNRKNRSEKQKRGISFGRTIAGPLRRTN